VISYVPSELRGYSNCAKKQTILLSPSGRVGQRPRLTVAPRCHRSSDDMGVRNQGERPTGLRSIDRTKQLVAPTTCDDNWAGPAALLLNGLRARSGNHAEVARCAVVVIKAEATKVANAGVIKIADVFDGLAPDVVAIPHDDGLTASINYGALQPATRPASLVAGAAAARGL
jgi:hypothetical protein